VGKLSDRIKKGLDQATIRKASFKRNDDGKQKAVLAFREVPHTLSVNETNAKVLIKTLGQDIRNYVGAVVDLTTEKVTFNNETYDAVRITDARRPQEFEADEEEAPLERDEIPLPPPKKRPVKRKPRQATSNAEQEDIPV
jgi:hypothetical protein